MTFGKNIQRISWKLFINSPEELLGGAMRFLDMSLGSSGGAWPDYRESKVIWLKNLRLIWKGLSRR